MAETVQCYTLQLTHGGILSHFLQLSVEGVTNVESLCDTLPLSHLCALRDGGLKRAKVKDAFKEEQQKLYSKVLVGEHEQADDKHLEDENPEEDKSHRDSANGQ